MLVSNKIMLATDTCSRYQKYNHWDYRFLYVSLEFFQYLLTIFWGYVIRCRSPNIICSPSFMAHPFRLDGAMWLIVEHFAAKCATFQSSFSLRCGNWQSSRWWLIHQPGFESLWWAELLDDLWWTCSTGGKYTVLLGLVCYHKLSLSYLRQVF